MTVCKSPGHWPVLLRQPGLTRSSCSLDAPGRVASRPDNDLIDGNEYELNKEPDKAHHNKAKRSPDANLVELFAIRFRATFYKPRTATSKVFHWGVYCVHSKACWSRLSASSSKVADLRKMKVNLGQNVLHA